MKKILFATVSLSAIALLNVPFTLAQSESVSEDLFLLCSKFPNNSKCKGIEVPIPLKERRGKEVGCNFRFDPSEFEQKEKCKLIADETGITIYKEHGDKLELLGDKRATSETRIEGDRVFSFNYQLWNKINRWEIGFLPDSSSETEDDTNFLVLLVDEKEAESINTEISPFASTKPKFIEDLIANSDNSFTDTEKLLDRLLETGECQYCDLSNADLSGLDLKEANLIGANLQGANLQEAKLNRSYLVGANLQEADLTGAELKGLNLTFANLERSILIDSELQGSNFQEANLQQADLTGVDLSAPAFLQGANLSQAILTDSNLKGANFQEANLQDADLTGADLAKTDVKLKDIPNNYDVGERLADYFIGLPIFALSSGGVDFFTSFYNANLQGANLSSTNLDRVDFENANLTNVDFSESNFDLEDLEEIEVKLCGVTLADGTKSDRDCP